MARQPAVGDKVSHEGRVADYTITAIRPGFDPETGAPITKAVWENDVYAVAGNVAELVWLPEDNAWYLPGRLLSGAERDLWAKHYGGANRNRPSMESHVEARATLREQHASEHRAVRQAEDLKYASELDLAHKAMAAKTAARELALAKATPEMLLAARKRRSAQGG